MIESDASNLVAGDTNAATDVFVHGALAATTSYAYDPVDRLIAVNRPGFRGDPDGWNQAAAVTSLLAW